MEQAREIQVRWIFRVVAGLISAGILSTFLFDFRYAMELWILDWFNLLCLLVTLPLLLYSAISGKMLPDFILQNISEEAYKELTNTEVFFTEFSAKSISFAVVALTMLAYIIYKNS